MKKCDYGCGREAITQFKTSKKWSCSLNVNSCPKKREKDSLSKKGRNPFEGKEHPKGMLGKKSWNSGKTLKEMDPSLAKKLRDGMIKGGRISGGCCSTPEKEIERRKKISETSKRNKLSGGYRKGSGKGKKGWYKGYFCDSSWELAWIIYNLDHGISFKRNTEKFSYTYNDIEKNYIPDFIMNDGTYVEIKGWLSEQAIQKINQFKKKIIVINKVDIKKYIDYVVDKYGKDYINMYE